MAVGKVKVEGEGVPDLEVGQVVRFQPGEGRRLAITDRGFQGGCRVAGVVAVVSRAV